MTTIDLNADMGESFGAYTIGCDEALLEIVSSANIACGFHGGDPSVMDATIKAAKAQGVRIGAHPGFNDLAGFGRRVIRGDSAEQIEHMLLYQIGAFQMMAVTNDIPLAYVKLHGSLANMAMVEAPFADAFVGAMRSSRLGVPVMAMPQSVVETSARREGVTVIREIYADRAYLPDGMLMPRSQPGAVIHDAATVCARVSRMVQERCIFAEDGTRIDTDIDSICVHGDNPQALGIAEKLRHDLEAAGFKIAPTTVS